MKRLCQRINGVLSGLLPGWRGARKLRGLHGTFDRLRGQRDELQAFTTAVEERFLAIGTALEALTVASSHLVQESDRLVTFGATDSVNQDDAVNRTLGLLQKGLGFFENFKACTARLIKFSEGYLENALSRQSAQTQLQRAIAPLRIIHTLLRVEAAGLPSESQTVFNAITTGIASLHGRMNEVCAQQLDSTSLARDKLKRVKVLLEKHRESQQQLLDHRQARLAESLSALSGHLEQLRNRNQRLAEISRTISARVGNVVVGLQYQDITRQKLEHVREALQDVEKKFDDFEKQPARRSWQSFAVFLVRSAHLQAAHLEDVKSEILSAQDRIATAAREIQALLSQIEASGLSAGEICETATSMQEVADSLLTALSEETEAVAPAVNGSREIQHATSTLSSLSDGLKHTIEGIALDIRLIALNAQVQAAQVGKGTGLGILGEFTREIADTAAHFDKSIRLDFQVQETSEQEITRESAGLYEAAEARQQLLNADAPSCRTDLNASSELVKSATGIICESLTQVRQQADTLLQLADFTQISQEALVTLAATLNEISSTATVFAADRST